MDKKHDFAIVGTRRINGKTKNSGPSGSMVNAEPKVVVPEVLEKESALPVKDVHSLTQAAADNFSRILDIAVQCVDIAKIREMSQAQINELQTKKELLETEAKSYVEKKNADTNAFVAKAERTRLLLEDYYKYNGSEKISAENFIKILEILNL